MGDPSLAESVLDFARNHIAERQTQAHANVQERSHEKEHGNMRYKLWDTDTDTLFGVSDSRAEIASLARRLLAQYDAEHADDLELIVETDDGESCGNTFGAGLVAWADNALIRIPVEPLMFDAHRRGGPRVLSGHDGATLG